MRAQLEAMEQELERVLDLCRGVESRTRARFWQPRGRKGEKSTSSGGERRGREHPASQQCIPVPHTARYIPESGTLKRERALSFHSLRQIPAPPEVVIPADLRTHSVQLSGRPRNTLSFVEGTIAAFLRCRLEELEEKKYRLYFAWIRFAQHRNLSLRGKEGTGRGKTVGGGSAPNGRGPTGGGAKGEDDNNRADLEAGRASFDRMHSDLAAEYRDVADRCERMEMKSGHSHRRLIPNKLETNLTTGDMDLFLEWFIDADTRSLTIRRFYQRFQVLLHRDRFRLHRQCLAILKQTVAVGHEREVINQSKEGSATQTSPEGGGGGMMERPPLR